MGYRHVFPQTSHGGHLVRMDCVYDAACPQEEKGLEHGMREQMEHGCHVAETSFMRIGRRTYAQRHDHESDLRNGTECQNPLDVALHAGDNGCVECGKCAHVCCDMEHFRSVSYEKREHPGHQIYAGHDHGRRMYKGRYRSRAFHCVRQPYMQREHRTFSCASDEHESESYRQEYLGRTDHCGIWRERERTGIESVDQYADKEAQIGESGHDECFL